MTAPVIMWFRQDLRLGDHPALAAASVKGPVIPVYILDDETPKGWSWGGASRWWLHHSLKALGETVPMVFRRGAADDVLAKLIEETGAQSVHFTRDYAPWAGALETRVKAVCDAHDAGCHRHGGFLLHEPEAIRNGTGEPYKVYSPFARACLLLGDPRPPGAAAKVAWAKTQIKSDRLEEWNLLPTKPDWAQGFREHWQPGEAGAQKRLSTFIDGALKGYAEGRDRTDQTYTSSLSPALHWGEISPVQVWHAVRHAQQKAGAGVDRDAEKFLKEVLWREFSYHLLHHFPQFPDKPFRPEFENFPWSPDSSAFKTWQRGKTGYPIVDAGLRQLWSTGIMHNRVRMIVASFLIKDLLIPWQDGERWFWDTLVDADIANNSASWQWVAGCGADAAPYYRIFNPVLQGEKFDPEGAYVKRWVPELAAVPTAFVHKPWEMAQPPQNYPPRMVDHAVARDRAMEAFSRIKKG